MHLVSRGLAGLVSLALTAACGAQAPTTTAHPSAVRATAAAAVSSTPRPLPVALTIPKLSLNQAPVDQVGLVNGAMDVPPKPTHVAWYKLGPAPGEQGDAVIDGHLNWTGLPEGPFFRLHTLAAGDEIDVTRSDGARQRFRVTSMASYPFTAHPAGLFATTGQPTLSLITCSGSWTGTVYSQRLVVTASYQGPM